MEFINRTKELKQLEEIYVLSKKNLMGLAISGLRRVGKTTLAKEFIKNKKSLYFFVYEAKTSDELLKEFALELKTNKVITELEKIETWHVFFEIILKRCINYVIVFDEFQNFYNIDKSIFSILQKNIDENKSPLNIIFLGSLVGLFKKIFEDKKQPLYGRIAIKINLKPFSLKDSLSILKILKYINFEEKLKIYGLFGGFPKYYSALEQFNLENRGYLDIVNYFFLQENAPFEDEVTSILKQEFGRRSSLYYSILYSIANGKTKLNEIATSVNMKESSITRHLLELEEKFELIKSFKPIDNKKSSIYLITHPLISFWFKFIYEKFSDYEIKAEIKILNRIKENFNSFFGRRFEEICKDFILELNFKNKLPFKIDYIGNWWGNARILEERKSIEIDLFALNNQENKALFVECKWRENVNSLTILRELNEKTKYVNWNKKNREEFFCVIAKSFSKKIDTFEGKEVYCFDLKDIENSLK